MTTAKKALFLIIFFSLIVRLAGISYGLPLWLIADEPPFVLGSLKMIELRTIIPRFHLEEFNSVLYYPPYLSYFYLPFFASSLFFDYFSFEGSMNDFRQFIGSDLSDFFIIARFLNIVLAVISIYLVYLISKNIFNDEWAALSSSFLLGTSLLYILLSMSSRQWLSIAFVLTLILYFLTKKSLSFNKKYFLSLLVAGLGLGISAITSIYIFLILLFYFFFEKKKIHEIFKEKVFYYSAGMLVLLAFLPLYLYPLSLGFKGAVTFFASKSFLGAASSPYFFLRPLFRAEPILMLFFISGLLISYKKRKEVFWPFLLFTFLYSVVFYIFFRFEHRFLVPLLPIFAILSGYGFRQFWNYIFTHERIIGTAVLAAFIFLPITFAGRLGYLAYQDDSRENARKWIEENIPEGEKIIVSSRLMRLSSNKNGINSQEEIDPNSLRQVDRAELYFGKNLLFPSYFALNLYSIDNAKLKENIQKIESSYDYLVLQRQDYRKDPELRKKINNIAERGSTMLTFGEDANFSVSESELGENPFDLLKTTMLGPEVSIYKLP